MVRREIKGEFKSLHTELSAEMGAEKGPAAADAEGAVRPHRVRRIPMAVSAAAADVAADVVDVRCLGIDARAGKKKKKRVRNAVKHDHAEVAPPQDAGFSVTVVSSPTDVAFQTSRFGLSPTKARSQIVTALGM